MIVLGIDPGSYVAGYGALRTGPRPEYVQCGVLRLPKAMPLNERLELLVGDLGELFDELDPVVLAIERAFLGDHAQALLVLSEIRGVVKGFALARGVRVLEYAPKTAKRTATGRGSATKADVRVQLMRRFGLEQPPPLDATDALAVALCGALEVSTGRGLGATLRPRKARSTA